MVGKHKYEKILARKKILLSEPGQSPKSVAYYNALELVRSNRRAGNCGLGNFYLQQIAEQVTEAPEPAVYLLSVYLDLMRINEAEILVSVLRDRFPVDSSALCARARFHEITGDWKKAEKLLLHAVSIYPRNANILEKLAALYQSIGKIEQALDCYERALIIDPQCCSVIFGIARLQRGKVDSKFIEHIHSVIASKKFEGIQLAFLQFALSHIYADIDIEQHFKYLHDANQTSASRRYFNVNIEQKNVENVLYRFRQPVIADLQGLVNGDFKPIFIVGMPRSGTTLLEQIIGAHGKCHPIGESNALAIAIEAANRLGCPALDVSTPDASARCRQYLGRIMENFKANPLVAKLGDKISVSKSMGDHMMLGLALLAMPNARVIHLERHPLAIIYSCYQQNFASGNNFTFRLEWLAEYYRLFKTLMAHWHAVLPGRILTVHYENLVRDKRTELERILKFCDLEWDDACMEHEKTVGAVLTTSNIQVREPVHLKSMDKWKRVESYLYPVKDLLGELADYPY